MILFPRCMWKQLLTLTFFFPWRYSPPDFSSMVGRETCPGTSTSDSSAQGGSSSSYNNHYCLGKMARKVYGGEVTTTSAWWPWMVDFQPPICYRNTKSSYKIRGIWFLAFLSSGYRKQRWVFLFLKDCATCSNIRIVVVTCCAVQFKAYQGEIFQTLAKRHAQSIKREESSWDGQT